MSNEGNPEINISEDRGQQDDDNSSVESNNEFKVPLPAKVRVYLEVFSLNLNSLLVKRQIDNPSPGAVTGGN